MKKWIKRIIITGLVSLCNFHFGSVLAEDACNQAKKKRIEGLLKDISAINLLNGLQTTTAQQQDLLALAKSVKTWRESMLDSESITHLLSESEAALRALKREIQKGEPATGDLPRKASRMNHKLKETREKVLGQAKIRFSEFEKQLGSILTWEQKKVVNDFKPCLIPPKDLRDPVKAGQAGSNEGIIKKLRKIRKIPEKVWEKRKGKIFEKPVEKFSQKKYKMSDEEKQAEIQRLIDIAEKVRALSDVQFEVEKENLAEEVKPEDKLAKLRKTIVERRPGNRGPKPSKAAKFLLDERIIPILEERLALARRQG